MALYNFPGLIYYFIPATYAPAALDWFFLLPISWNTTFIPVSRFYYCFLLSLEASFPISSPFWLTLPKIAFLNLITLPCYIFKIVFVIMRNYSTHLFTFSYSLLPSCPQKHGSFMSQKIYVSFISGILPTSKNTL